MKSMGVFIVHKRALPIILKTQFVKISTTMSDPTDESYDKWAVVLNHEEQYSIWDTHYALPGGWREEGVKGAQHFCFRLCFFFLVFEFGAANSIAEGAMLTAARGVAAQAPSRRASTTLTRCGPTCGPSRCATR